MNYQIIISFISQKKKIMNTQLMEKIIGLNKYN